MEGRLSEFSLSVLFFTAISTVFVLTMLCFFDQKMYDKHRRLHNFFLGILIWLWISSLVFEPLAKKIFATLMLASVVIVETAVKKQRKREKG